MSQSSQLDNSGALAKLSIGVLLNVFNDCDVTDVLSLAFISKQKAESNVHVQISPLLTYVLRLARNFAQLRKDVPYDIHLKWHYTARFRQALFRSGTKKSSHLHSTAQLKP